MWVRRILRSRILGNTGLMAGGMAMRLFLQVGYFAIVARGLGSEAFGEFASVVAVAMMVSAFSGWGGDQMLVRAVARDPLAFRSAFGNALSYLALSAAIASIVALGLVGLVNDRAPLSEIVLVVLADVIFARVNVLAAACFQAHEKTGRTALLNIGLSAARLAGAVLWIGAAEPHGVESWAWFYMGTSAIVAFASLILVVAELGRPHRTFDRSLWRDGFHFSAQLASFNAFRDVDKPILARLASLEAAGLYAASFRVVDASLVLVRSLMFASYVRFFQHGVAGTRGSIKFAMRLLPVAVLLGIGTGAALAAAAPFLPLIIGRSYAGTENVVYVLAVLPVLYALYYVGGDVLNSAGHVGARTAIQLGVLLLQTALCLFAAPRYGALGVAIASVTIHAVLAATSWITVWRLAIRS